MEATVGEGGGGGEDDPEDEGHGDEEGAHGGVDARSPMMI
jgi:hypothetical protein